MKSLCILLVLSILLFCPKISANELVNLPLEHQAYNFLRRLTAKGIIKKRFYTTLPLTRGEVAKILLEVKKKSLNDEIELTKIETSNLEQLMWLFGDEIEAFAPELSIKEREHLLKFSGENYSIDFDSFLKQELATSKSSKERHTTSITSVDFSLMAKLGSNIGIYELLHSRGLLGSSEYNPYRKEVTYKQTEEFRTLSSMEAYAVLTLPYISLQWGIDRFWWGPGQHGAMLLSSNSPPTDTLKLSGIYPPFKFTYITSVLESYSKYLSGHRLEFIPYPGINIGLSDIVLFSEKYQPRFANPFVIYFLMSSGVEDKKTNFLLGLDIDITLLPNIELYAEGMIDDFQPQKGLDSFKAWSSKYGLLLGLTWIDLLFLNSELNVEYAFINQYAYTHRSPMSRYIHRGFFIGHWMGNDADNLWINLKHCFTDKISGSISYELKRHGETDITEGSDYKKLTAESVEWEFLSGVTESTHSFSVGASYNLIGRYSVDLEYIHSWIRNVSNRDDINDTRNQVLLRGQYRF